MPAADKAGIWLGMGMTEKQGGSDVRANTTVATAMGAGGRGGEYRCAATNGSSPRRSATRTGDGARRCGWPLRLFLRAALAPRRRPQRRARAAPQRQAGQPQQRQCRGRLEDAWGILIGEEGRGIPTIIEMAGYTRA